jgi:hypothetical protein
LPKGFNHQDAQGLSELKALVGSENLALN